jgi:hypothetical protein
MYTDCGRESFPSEFTSRELRVVLSPVGIAP